MNKQKREHKVPKYKLRRLSIGVVSFLCGFSVFCGMGSISSAHEMIVSPQVSEISIDREEKEKSRHISSTDDTGYAKTVKYNVLIEKDANNSIESSYHANTGTDINYEVEDLSNDVKSPQQETMIGEDEKSSKKLEDIKNDIKKLKDEIKLFNWNLEILSGDGEIGESDRETLASILASIYEKVNSIKKINNIASFLGGNEKIEIDKMLSEVIIPQLPNVGKLGGNTKQKSVHKTEERIEHGTRLLAVGYETPGRYASKDGIYVSEYRTEYSSHSAADYIRITGIDINNVSKYAIQLSYRVDGILIRQNIRRRMEYTNYIYNPSTNSIDIRIDALTSKKSDGLIFASNDYPMIDKLKVGDLVSIYDISNGEPIHGTKLASRVVLSDSTDLRKKVEEGKLMEQEEYYLHASDSLKNEYTQAKSVSEELIRQKDDSNGNENPTQEKIDTAKQNLDTIMNKIKDQSSIDVVGDLLQEAESARDAANTRLRAVSNGEVTEAEQNEIKGLVDTYNQKLQNLNNTWNGLDQSTKAQYQTRYDALKKVPVPPIMGTIESFYGYVNPSGKTTIRLPFKIDPSIYEIYFAKPDGVSRNGDNNHLKFSEDGSVITLNPGWSFGRSGPATSGNKAIGMIIRIQMKSSIADQYVSENRGYSTEIFVFRPIVISNTHGDNASAIKVGEGQAKSTLTENDVLSSVTVQSYDPVGRVDNADASKLDTTNKAYVSKVLKGQLPTEGRNVRATVVLTSYYGQVQEKEVVVDFVPSKQELTTALNGAVDYKNDANYKNADQNLREAYDRALAEATTLNGKNFATDTNVTKAEVTRVAKALTDARTALNGTSKIANLLQEAESARDAANTRLRAVSNGEVTEAEQNEIKGLVDTYNQKLQNLNNTWNGLDQSTKAQYQTRYDALKKVPVPPIMGTIESFYGYVNPSGKTTIRLPFKIDPSIYEIYFAKPDGVSRNGDNNHLKFSEDGSVITLNPGWSFGRSGPATSGNKAIGMIIRIQMKSSIADQYVSENRGYSTEIFVFRPIVISNTHGDNASAIKVGEGQAKSTLTENDVLSSVTVQSYDPVGRVDNADASKLDTTNKAYVSKVLKGQLPTEGRNVRATVVLTSYYGQVQEKEVVVDFVPSKQELTTALNGAVDYKNDANYKNADQNLREAYDRALAEATTLNGKNFATDTNVTKAEVTRVAKALTDARTALNGTSKIANLLQEAESARDAANTRLRAVSNGEVTEAEQNEIKGLVDTYNQKLQNLNNTWNGLDQSTKAQYQTRYDALKKVPVPPIMGTIESFYGYVNPSGKTTIRLPFKIDPSIYEIYFAKPDGVSRNGDNNHLKFSEDGSVITLNPGWSFGRSGPATSGNKAIGMIIRIQMKSSIADQYVSENRGYSTEIFVFRPIVISNTHGDNASAIKVGEGQAKSTLTENDVLSSVTVQSYDPVGRVDNADASKLDTTNKAYVSKVLKGQLPTEGRNVRATVVLTSYYGQVQEKEVVVDFVPSKQELTTALNGAVDYKNDANYKNADQNLREAYDRALAEATTLNGKNFATDTNVTKAEVTRVAKALTDARTALNGNENSVKETAAREKVQAAKDALDAYNNAKNAANGVYDQDTVNNLTHLKNAADTAKSDAVSAAEALDTNNKTEVLNDANSVAQASEVPGVNDADKNGQIDTKDQEETAAREKVQAAKDALDAYNNAKNAANGVYDQDTVNNLTHLKNAADTAKSDAVSAAEALDTNNKTEVLNDANSVAQASEVPGVNDADKNGQIDTKDQEETAAREKVQAAKDALDAYNNAKNAANGVYDQDTVNNLTHLKNAADTAKSDAVSAAEALDTNNKTEVLNDANAVAQASEVPGVNDADKNGQIDTKDQEETAAREKVQAAKDALDAYNNAKNAANGVYDQDTVNNLTHLKNAADTAKSDAVSAAEALDTNNKTEVLNDANSVAQASEVPGVNDADKNGQIDTKDQEETAAREKVQAAKDALDAYNNAKNAANGVYDQDTVNNLTHLKNAADTAKSDAVSAAEALDTNNKTEVLNDANSVAQASEVPGVNDADKNGQIDTKDQEETAAREKVQAAKDALDAYNNAKNAANGVYDQDTVNNLTHLKNAADTAKSDAVSAAEALDTNNKTEVLNDANSVAQASEVPGVNDADKNGQIDTKDQEETAAREKVQAAKDALDAYNNAKNAANGVYDQDTVNNLTHLKNAADTAKSDAVSAAEALDTNNKTEVLNDANSVAQASEVPGVNDADKNGQIDTKDQEETAAREKVQAAKDALDAYNNAKNAANGVYDQDTVNNLTHLKNAADTAKSDAVSAAEALDTNNKTEVLNDANSVAQASEVPGVNDADKNGQIDTKDQEETAAREKVQAAKDALDAYNNAKNAANGVYDQDTVNNLTHLKNAADTAKSDAVSAAEALDTNNKTEVLNDANSVAQASEVPGVNDADKNGQIDTKDQEETAAREKVQAAKDALDAYNNAKNAANGVYDQDTVNNLTHLKNAADTAKSDAVSAAEALDTNNKTEVLNDANSVAQASEVPGVNDADKNGQIDTKDQEETAAREKVQAAKDALDAYNNAKNAANGVYDQDTVNNLTHLKNAADTAKSDAVSAAEALDTNNKTEVLNDANSVAQASEVPGVNDADKNGQIDTKDQEETAAREKVQAAKDALDAYNNAKNAANGVYDQDTVNNLTHLKNAADTAKSDAVSAAEALDTNNKTEVLNDANSVAQASEVPGVNDADKNGQIDTKDQEETAAREKVQAAKDALDAYNNAKNAANGVYDQDTVNNLTHLKNAADTAKSDAVSAAEALDTNNKTEVLNDANSVAQASEVPGVNDADKNGQIDTKDQEETAAREKVQAAKDALDAYNNAKNAANGVYDQDTVNNLTHLKNAADTAKSDAVSAAEALDTNNKTEVLNDANSVAQASEVPGVNDADKNGQIDTKDQEETAAREKVQAAKDALDAYNNAKNAANGVYDQDTVNNLTHLKNAADTAKSDAVSAAEALDTNNKTEVLNDANSVAQASEVPGVNDADKNGQIDTKDQEETAAREKVQAAKDALDAYNNAKNAANGVYDQDTVNNLTHLKNAADTAKSDAVSAAEALDTNNKTEVLNDANSVAQASEVPGVNDADKNGQIDTKDQEETAAREKVQAAKDALDAYNNAKNAANGVYDQDTVNNLTHLKNAADTAKSDAVSAAEALDTNNKTEVLNDANSVAQASEVPGVNDADKNGQIDTKDQEETAAREKVQAAKDALDAYNNAKNAANGVYDQDTVNNLTHLKNAADTAKSDAVSAAEALDTNNKTEVLNDANSVAQASEVPGVNDADKNGQIDTKDQEETAAREKVQAAKDALDAYNNAKNAANGVYDQDTVNNLTHLKNAADTAKSDAVSAAEALDTNNKTEVLNDANSVAQASEVPGVNDADKNGQIDTKDQEETAAREKVQAAKDALDAYNNAKNAANGVYDQDTVNNLTHLKNAADTAKSDAVSAAEALDTNNKTEVLNDANSVAQASEVPGVNDADKNGQIDTKDQEETAAREKVQAAKDALDAYNNAKNAANGVYDQDTVNNLTHLKNAADTAKSDAVSAAEALDTNNKTEVLNDANSVAQASEVPGVNDADKNGQIDTKDQEETAAREKVQAAKDALDAYNNAKNAANGVYDQDTVNNLTHLKNAADTAKSDAVSAAEALDTNNKTEVLNDANSVAQASEVPGVNDADKNGQIDTKDQEETAAREKVQAAKDALDAYNNAKNAANGVYDQDTVNNLTHLKNAADTAKSDAVSAAEALDTNNKTEVLNDANSVAQASEVPGVNDADKNGQIDTKDQEETAAREKVQAAKDALDAYNNAKNAANGVYDQDTVNNLTHLKNAADTAKSDAVSAAEALDTNNKTEVLNDANSVAQASEVPGVNDADKNGQIDTKDQEETAAREKVQAAKDALDAYNNAKNAANGVYDQDTVNNLTHLKNAADTAKSDAVSAAEALDTNNKTEVLNDANSVAQASEVPGVNDADKNGQIDTKDQEETAAREKVQAAKDALDAYNNAKNAANGVYDQDTVNNLTHLKNAADTAKSDAVSAAEALDTNNKTEVLNDANSVAQASEVPGVNDADKNGQIDTKDQEETAAREKVQAAKDALDAYNNAKNAANGVYDQDTVNNLTHLKNAADTAKSDAVSAAEALDTNNKTEVLNDANSVAQASEVPGVNDADKNGQIDTKDQEETAAREKVQAAKDALDAYNNAKNAANGVYDQDTVNNLTHLKNAADTAKSDAVSAAEALDTNNKTEVLNDANSVAQASEVPGVNDADKNGQIDTKDGVTTSTNKKHEKSEKQEVVKKEKTQDKGVRYINNRIKITPVGIGENGKYIYNRIAYIKGYPDNTVRPNNDLTRAEVAMILARLDGLNLENNKLPKFKDTQTKAWYNAAINAVVEKGYMKGYPDGRFLPNQKITRAELANIMVNVYSVSGNELKEFSDIKLHWAEDAIKKAYASGFVNGYEDGTFKPDQYITRAESVKMFNILYLYKLSAENILKVEESKGFKDFKDNEKKDWYYDSIVESTNDYYFTLDNKGVNLSNIEDETNINHVTVGIDDINVLKDGYGKIVRFLDNYFTE